MSTKEKVKSYCSTCGRETNHEIIVAHSISHRDDYDCDIKYQIVGCLGCEFVSFRKSFVDIESAYPNRDGEWEVPEENDVYPRVLQGHVGIEDIFHLPDVVGKIYTEVLTAITEDARILSGLGLRGVVEAVCNDLGITGRSLETRINKLASSGHISKSDAERLHAIRFMGNDAAHEIRRPHDGALRVALKIVEHLLQSVYILEKEVEGRLEPAISKYEKFETLLLDALNEYSPGDELPLAKFLGKDLRRVKESISILESELISKIQSGAFTSLSIGRVDAYQGSQSPLQHFVVQSPV
ncbi:DUF4145 domain-containing protein [Vulcanococcus limneticus]|uniref:DUF4145 domain-containing protein n=1 Tax=Vulcanococcus limneticus TaxID=2170428 RepID=UPI00398C2387